MWVIWQTLYYHKFRQINSITFLESTVWLLQLELCLLKTFVNWLMKIIFALSVENGTAMQLECKQERALAFLWVKESTVFILSKVLINSLCVINMWLKPIGLKANHSWSCTSLNSLCFIFLISFLIPIRSISIFKIRNYAKHPFFSDQSYRLNLEN